MFKLAKEALSNLRLYKVRTGLAALGIIFGVASIICMLSISEIARKDVIERIQRMGVENIIIDSVKPSSLENQQEKAKQAKEQSLSTYGITLNNVTTLKENLVDLDSITMMRVFAKPVKSSTERSKMFVVATDSNYAYILNHRVKAGQFISPLNDSLKSSVCVLGAKAARILYPLGSPLGQKLKIDDQFFNIIGVMEEKGRTGDSGNLSDPDSVVYIPISTSLSRFGSVGNIASQNQVESQIEINRVVIKAKQGSSLKNISKSCKNYLTRVHRQEDVVVTIPSQLLEERQQAEKIFKWVMGSLAGISLLVGGIGITNIMLANMSERRSEIGLRRALGATKLDIVRLFLIESTILCLISGIVGVGIGVGLAHLVGGLANWSVYIVPVSIPLGIGVSTLTGLFFGTFPSIKAARYDPVQALRMD